MPVLAARSATHQTVRLGRGRHWSAEREVCVMELASMLAGEPFSDRPRTACMVIGDFLRCYNDAVDERRRQDLFGCAAAVVGTRAPALEGRRARLCVEALREVIATMPRWRRRRQMRWTDTSLGTNAGSDIARLTARVLATAGEAGHHRALRLVAEMVEIGDSSKVDRARLPQRTAGAALGTLPTSGTDQRSPSASSPT